MLVEIGDRFVNTAHIATVEPVPSATDSGRSRVRLADGETLLADSRHVGFEDLCGVIVPAQPGFVLIEAFLPPLGEGDSRVHYTEKAIVAFRVIGSTAAPRPITLSGEPTDRSNVSWIAQQPGGRCVDFDGICMTVEDFKAECQATAARRAAATA